MKGASAFIDGLPVSANPYHDPGLRQAWEGGWKAARETAQEQVSIEEEPIRWPASSLQYESRGEREGSGMEPIPGFSAQRCIHPEHNPPGYICVPSGHRYRHVCPACGKKSYIFAKDITC